MGVRYLDRLYTDPAAAGPPTLDWLIGNVFDWQQLVIGFQYRTEAKSSQTSPFSIELYNSIRRFDGQDWSVEGFEVGDSIDIFYNTHIGGGPAIPTFISTTIEGIDGDLLTVAATFGPPITSTFPGQTVNGAGDQVLTTNMTVTTDKQPEGCMLEYTHRSEDLNDGSSMESIIDNSTIRFKVSEIDTLLPGGSKVMTSEGFRSGGTVVSATLLFLNEASGTYNYQFIIKYMISPLYQSLGNIDNLNPPTWYLDTNSLADNFRATFYPTYNNPNISLVSDPSLSKQQGNVGWLNENYNGGPDAFTIQNFTLTDSLSNPKTAVDYREETNFFFDIAGINNLGPSTEFKLIFAHLPADPSEYTQNEFTWAQNTYTNTMGDTVVYTPGVYNGPFLGYSKESRRVDLKDIEAQVVGGVLRIAGTIQPNGIFGDYIDEKVDTDRRYIFAVMIADHTLEKNDSDRVTKTVDIGNMINIPSPVGPKGITSKVIRHYEFPGDIGTTGAVLFDEEGVLTESLLTLDTSTPERLQRVICQVEAVNTVTGGRVVLESETMDVEDAPIDGQSIQQIDYQSTRGFFLPTGDDKNFLNVIRDDANDAAPVRAYNIQYAFKTRYEDWIANTDIPGEFFDATKLLNNLNNRWVFKQMGDYVLKYVIYSVIDDGEEKTYIDEFDFQAVEYGDSTEWQYAVQHRNQSGQSLYLGLAGDGRDENLILDDELTHVEVSFFNQLGNLASVDDYHAVIRIQIEQGAGFKTIAEISTVIDPRADNPLQPRPGETRAKKSIAAPNELLVECDIDPDLLADATRYRVSGHVWGLVTPGGKQKEDGTIKEKEDGTTKLLE